MMAIGGWPTGPLRDAYCYSQRVYTIKPCKLDKNDVVTVYISKNNQEAFAYFVKNRHIIMTPRYKSSLSTCYHHPLQIGTDRACYYVGSLHFPDWQ